MKNRNNKGIHIVTSNVLAMKKLSKIVTAAIMKMVRNKVPNIGNLSSRFELAPISAAPPIINENKDMVEASKDE